MNDSPFGPVRLLSARNRHNLSINDRKAIQAILEELDQLRVETPQDPTYDLLLAAIITECAERLLRRR